MIARLPCGFHSGTISQQVSAGSLRVQMRRRIFINYRRDDSSAYSGRLYDRLLARFPNQVFRDVGSLEPGMRWDVAIAHVVSEADVCIVVIGPSWLTLKDGQGNRRLDNPDDNVRKEIVTALQHGAKIIPVLVGRAQMPERHELPPDIQGLCDWQAIELTDQNWEDCCRTLIRGIEDSLGLQPLPPGEGRRRFSKMPMIVGLSSLGILVIIGVVLAAVRSKSAVNQQTENHPIVVPNPSTGGGGDDSTNRQTGTHAPVPPAQPANDTRVAVPVSTDVAGRWRAIVTMVGRPYDEMFDLYPDHSFRITFAGSSTAVGTWQSDPNSRTIQFVHATNFTANGLKFSCQLQAGAENAEAYAGSCVDPTGSATVSMNHVSNSAEAVPDIPRVDTSALTLGERAVFAHYLETQRCTCPCGLTLMQCLTKDLTCPYSPRLAATALATFMAMTRS